MCGFVATMWSNLVSCTLEFSWQEQTNWGQGGGMKMRRKEGEGETGVKGLDELIKSWRIKTQAMLWFVFAWLHSPNMQLINSSVFRRNFCEFRLKTSLFSTMLSIATSSVTSSPGSAWSCDVRGDRDTWLATERVGVRWITTSRADGGVVSSRKKEQEIK